MTKKRKGNLGKKAIFGKVFHTHLADLRDGLTPRQRLDVMRNDEKRVYSMRSGIRWPTEILAFS